MCGIFGYLQYKEGGKANLSALTKGLAIAAQIRGNQATGISFVNELGLVEINRQAVPATKFQFNLPKNKLAAIVGHTRQTTQGSEKKPQNNHPFPGKLNNGSSFSLAHNGVLDNDYEIQDEEKFPETDVETDSYVAVQLLEKFTPIDSGIDFPAMKTMAEKVSGMFAFTILTDGGELWIVRNDSPVHLVLLESLGLYVYGSTETIVIAGLKAAGLLKTKRTIIPVDGGTITRIDANGNMARDKFKINNSYYGTNWEKYAIAGGGGSKRRWSRDIDYDAGSDEIHAVLEDEGLSSDECALMFETYTDMDLVDAIAAGEVEELLLGALRYEFKRQRGLVSHARAFN